MEVRRNFYLPAIINLIMENVVLPSTSQSLCGRCYHIQKIVHLFCLSWLQRKQWGHFKVMSRISSLTVVFVYSAVIVNTYWTSNFRVLKIFSVIPFLQAWCMQFRSVQRNHIRLYQNRQTANLAIPANSCKSDLLSIETGVI